MKNKAWIGLLGISFLSMTAMLCAETVTLDGAGLKKDFHCKGKSVYINGAGCEIIIRGQCPELKVDGAGNKVWVEYVGKINAAGSGHEIIWAQAMDGIEPDIEDKGSSKIISEAQYAEEQRRNHHHHGKARHDGQEEAQEPAAEYPSAAGYDDRGPAAEPRAEVVVQGGKSAVVVSAQPGGAAVEVAHGNQAVSISKTSAGGSMTATSGKNQVSVSNRGVRVETPMGSVKVKTKPDGKVKVKVNADIPAGN